MTGVLLEVQSKVGNRDLRFRDHQARVLVFELFSKVLSKGNIQLPGTVEVLYLNCPGLRPFHEFPAFLDFQLLTQLLTMEGQFTK